MASQQSKSEYQGRWWVPEHPEQPVPGVLRLTPYQVADLELFGHLDLELGPYSGFILGEAVDGTLLTLSELFIISITGQGKGVHEKREIQAETVFIDGQWPAGGPIQFSEIEVEFRNLCSWSHYCPFRFETGANDGTRKVILNPDEIIPLFEDDTITITLKNSASTRSSWNIGENEGHVRRKATIVLHSKEELPYSEYLPLIEQIQSFLSFCFGFAIIPESIIGRSIVHSLSRLNSQEPALFPISIETTSFHREEADQYRDKKTKNPPISFDEIREYSPDLLQRWLESEEQFKIPRMLFLSTFFSPQMYLQQVFLNRSQCIEIYSRISNNYRDYLTEPDEYDHRVQEVRFALRWCSDLNKKQYERFISQIKNSNRPSLMNRIDQILKHHEFIGWIIIDAPPEFAHTIAKNRNYLTHCEKKPEEKYATPQELWDLSQQLGRLFYLCMLDEIGVEQELIMMVMRRLKEWIIL